MYTCRFRIPLSEFTSASLCFLQSSSYTVLVRCTFCVGKNAMAGFRSSNHKASEGLEENGLENLEKQTCWSIAKWPEIRGFNQSPTQWARSFPLEPAHSTIQSEIEQYNNNTKIRQVTEHMHIHIPAHCFSFLRPLLFRRPG